MTEHLPVEAESDDSVERPRDWDKAVAVAYLRLLGIAQEGAATQAGVGARTLRRWENSDWWPQAQNEARGRWLQDLDSSARFSLLKHVKSDGRLALEVLSRMEAAIASPDVRRRNVPAEQLRDLLIELAQSVTARVSSEEERTLLLGDWRSILARRAPEMGEAF